MILWLELLPKILGLVGSGCLLRQALHMNKTGRTFDLISKTKLITEKTKIIRDAHNRLESSVRNQVLKWTWWDSIFLYGGIFLIITSYLVDIILISIGNK